MSHIIGLDVGIASLGWGVIDTEKQEIIDAGVRIFTKAEVPKTGASLAEPRRIARSMRRRIRRRRHRLDRIKHLFITFGLLTEDQQETAFLSGQSKLSPWQLRYDGLSRKLEDIELSRALYHIAVRRGFKSNRKSELQEKDAGKLLAGVTANAELFDQRNYKTLGEMFYKDEKFIDKKRNHRESYAHTVARDMLVDEINIIFDKQRILGNEKATLELQKQYLAIFCSQRSYDDGAQIDQMRGKCTFEANCKRAPKFCYSAERFVLTSKINNLTIFEEGKDRKHLSNEQKKVLLDLPYQFTKVTYKQIRDKLAISEEYKFSELNYFQSNKKGKDAELQTFAELKGFHELRKSVEKSCSKTEWANLTGQLDKLDDIAEILTCWKTDDNRQRELNKLNLSQSLIDAVIPIGSFSQFVNLSTSCIKKLLPLLESGLRYDQASKDIYGNHHSKNNTNKSELLPLIPYEDVGNPVVYRALTQARKVLNAIVRKYGSADRIHIELARDVSKSFKERKKIEKAQGEFRSEKESIKNQFTECYGTTPGGHDLLKFRLHKQQNSKCPYSGKTIDSTRLIEPGYVDIDHILPWSRSFDDSLNNKVLVLTEENRNKGNKTPFEYIAQGDKLSKEWLRFTAEIAHYPQAKRWRLLKENFDDKSSKEFKNRNASDTSYIARFLKNFIEQNLQFKGDDRQPVQTSNGVLTNYLRVRWGLLKDRIESDRHHAIDALLVAGITRSMIQKLSDASRRQELWASDAPRGAVEELIDRGTGEVIASNFQQHRKLRMPQPWKNFSQQVRNYVANEVFVSRAPQRKLKGAVHEETIRSGKNLSEGYAVVKKLLEKLTLKTLEDLNDKERNVLLYNALKSRLEAHGGKADKAFAEPFYMPLSEKKRSSGVQAPRVYSVKIRTTMNDGVFVNKGVAAHDTMVRIDLFKKDGKFFIVPLYVADMVKSILPNKAIVAKKYKKDWPEMDDSYHFCFSLHRNDLIEIKHKQKGVLMGYYAGCDVATGAISLTLPDRSLPPRGNLWVKDKMLTKMRTKGENEIRSIGVKTGLEYFHKYEVSVLGEINRVTKEGKRDGLA